MALRCKKLGKKYITKKATQTGCFLDMKARVVNLGSNTFGNPILNGLTKLAVLLNYKYSKMLCLALPTRPEVPKLDIQSEHQKSTEPF